MPGSNFVSGYASSAFEFNLNGYSGLGGGKDFKSLMIEGSVNTMGNIIGNGISNTTQDIINASRESNKTP